jgi:hypothetical protein
LTDTHDPSRAFTVQAVLSRRNRRKIQIDHKANTASSGRKADSPQDWLTAREGLAKERLADADITTDKPFLVSRQKEHTYADDYSVGWLEHGFKGTPLSKHSLGNYLRVGPYSVQAKEGGSRGS